MSATRRLRDVSRSRLALAAVVALALAIDLWGIRRDLPYLPETDEPFLINPTVWMATEWNPDPGWFDHPASTLVYPLAVLNHLWNAAAYGGPLLHPDPNLPDHHRAAPAPNYLMGRLLAVAYAVGTVPLVYRLGAAAFGPATGLLGAWLSILSPLAIDHAQMARSDSAATFFGVLALWLCCGVLDGPTMRRQLLAGAAIGLAISSRYFMVALGPVLAGIDLAVLRRDGRSAWPGIVAGLGAVVVVFAATSPYALIDYRVTMQNLRGQAGPVHPGADGLSHLGNLAFYLGDAFPAAVTVPVALVAIAGAALALGRRGKPVLLVAYVVVFMFGVCLSATHWARWIIPLVPAVCLLAAAAVAAAPGGTPVALAAAVLLSVWPVARAGSYVLQATAPSTRLRARDWMVRELPPGTRVAADWQSAALHGTSFDVDQRFAVSERPLDAYRAEGRRYLVVSTDVYWRFLREPARYPGQVSFYRTLFTRERRLVEIAPTATSRGPTIDVYDLGG